MRKSVVLLGILFLLLAATAITGNAQQTLRIGVAGPHSGPAAFDGQQTLVGAQIAAKHINDAGGVLGKKIEILAGDTRGIPADAVSVVRKLVVQDKIVGLDCCWFSSSTIAVASVIDELKIPTTNGISFRPDLSKTPYRYLFKFAQVPEIEGRFADYWVKVLGIKKVAFLARNDDWGRAAAGAYMSRLIELGGEKLSEDYYVPGEKDFTAYMTKIKALKPEAIDIVDVIGTTATMLKAMRDLGIEAQALGSDGQVVDKFIELAGGTAEGFYVVTRYEAYMDTPKNKKFVDTFKEVRKGETPDQYAQAGYDSIYMQVEAIQRAGSTDPEKMREELKKTDYLSVSGTRFKFDEAQQSLPNLYVAKIHKGVRVIMHQIYPFKPL